jgi:hypothetical protein
LFPNKLFCKNKSNKWLAVALTPPDILKVEQKKLTLWHKVSLLSPSADEMFGKGERQEEGE